MADRPTLLDLAEAAGVRQYAGGKAAVLGEMVGAGLPVPPGFVVTAAALTDSHLDARLEQWTGRYQGRRFAVRSSAVAEDLPDASYAGLYETFLDVPPGEVGGAVRRCFAAVEADRVRAYHQRRDGSAGQKAMAVLVQVMIDAVTAGVAFTAHPVTGERDQVVISAVAGLGESLVSGKQTGEEWTVAGARLVRTRAAASGEDVLSAADARRVAELADRVDAHYGRAQDIEWAIDRAARLWLLQARPMTALAEPVSFVPPGPGVWMRNFRLGEWLPEAVTPLFGTWLLLELEAGYLDGMQHSIGVRVPFRWTLLHDWYYTAPPIPSARLIGQVIVRGRGRALKTLYNALFRVGRDPEAADRAVLSRLYHDWREVELPRYRQLVDTAAAEVDKAAPRRLAELASAIAHAAGRYMWFLAIVGGSAWKMEARLGTFSRAHLAGVLEPYGGVQALLRGLPGADPGAHVAHAVQSLDWYHPTAAEFPSAPTDLEAVAARRRQLGADRKAAEAACRTALAGRPRLLAGFDSLLRVAQRYAVIREEQSHDFTLGWPVLRRCAAGLGTHLVDRGLLSDGQAVHFCSVDEVMTAIAGAATPLALVAQQRHTRWDRNRRLSAPVTLGRPPRLIGDVIENAVRAARVGDVPDGAIAGHPASAGRATGPVRIVTTPEDFAAFRDGEVLVAKATAPAWTPLFARAVAIVTDGGTLAAHASLVAREYGIPAVVGTGDATARLHNGQTVVVDGTRGTVAPLH